MTAQVHHRYASVDAQRIFYREAGVSFTDPDGNAWIIQERGHQNA